MIGGRNRVVHSSIQGAYLLVQRYKLPVNIISGGECYEKVKEEDKESCGWEAWGLFT